MSTDLEQIKGLETTRALLVQVINKLRESRALEDDPVRQVRYENQILEKEAELRKVEALLQEALSINSYTGRSLLAQEVAGLGIGRNLGSLDLVNCNREKPKDWFWQVYDKLEAQRFQFYFLTSCETQKPGSFAERMLYEYLAEELNEATDALHYQRDSRYAELGRPRIDPLPVGRNLANSENAFRRYFADFWNLPETQSMEAYLHTGLPRSGFDAAAMFFQLEAIRWKEDVTRPYLEWMIKTLQSAHQEVPRVLVFVKVVVDQAHLKPAETAATLAFQEIESILAQHPGVAHLVPLNPVREDDLKRWFRDLRAQNTAKLDRLIEMFVNSLDEADRRLFAEKQQFNMDDVEILQQEVFKVINGLDI